MNRAEFQRLAEVRVREAEALLAAGLWDGAYYLAGYAVECGLKACIAKLTRAEDFPPDRRFVEACYSHNLAGLLKTAGLQDQFDADAAADPNLLANWVVVSKWSEQSRYMTSPEPEARTLVGAVRGVLAWLTRIW